MTYIPTTYTDTLKVSLGKVLICSGPMTAGSHTLTATGMGFNAQDVGNWVMVYYAGALRVGQGGSLGVPLVSKITAFISPNSVTLQDAAITTTPAVGNTVTVVVFRPVHCASGSINFSSSMGTKDSGSFTVRTIGTTGKPLAGQPYLIEDTNLGPLIGGGITIVKGTKMPGTTTVEWACTCGTWDAVLYRTHLQYLTDSTTTVIHLLSYTVGNGGHFSTSTPPTVVIDPPATGGTQATAHCVMTSHVALGVTFWAVSSIVLDNAGSGYVQVPHTALMLNGTDYNSSVGVTLNTDAPAGTGEGYSVNPNPSNGSFTNKDGGFIATWLLDNTKFGMVNYGIGYSTMTFGPVIASITVSPSDTLGSAFDSITNSINDGINDYWWGTDPFGRVTFQLNTATTAPWNIDDTAASDGNVLQSITVESSLEKFVVSALVNIQAATDASTSTDQFVGNGANKSFNLSQGSVSSAPTALIKTSGGTEACNMLIVGATQPTGVIANRSFYWSPGSSTINQATNGTALTSAQTLVVTYFATHSTLVVGTNTAAATARELIEGGAGLVYDAYYDNNNSSGSIPIQDGQNLADAISKYYGVLPSKLNVYSYRGGYKVGQLATIHLTDLGVSGNYIVSAVSLSTDGNRAMWAITLLVGALVGDWKQAFVDLTNKGSIFLGAGGGSSTSDSNGPGAAPTPPTIVGPAAIAYYSVNGDWWDFGFNGNFLIPTNGSTDLSSVLVNEISPDGTLEQNLTTIPGPFNDGDVIGWKTDADNPLKAAENWTIRLYPINADGLQGTPTDVVVPVAVPIATIGTISEPANSRYIVNTQRQVNTKLQFPITVSNNPGGPTGRQVIALWVKYDRGDITGIVTIWEGYNPVSGGSTGNLTIDIVIPLATTTLTAYPMAYPSVAKGTTDDPIPAIALAHAVTFNFQGPEVPTVGGDWISGANFTQLAVVGGVTMLKYFSSGGAYEFHFGLLTCTTKFSTKPTMRAVIAMVMDGFYDSAAHTWTPRPDSPLDKNWASGNTTNSDGNSQVTRTGNVMTFWNKVVWSVRDSTDLYPDVRIHLDVTYPVDGLQVIQAAFAGQSSPCAEIFFSADGQYCYVKPSIANARLTASPWDPALLGDGMGTDSGKRLVRGPFRQAPAVTASTSGVVNTLLVGGVGYWTSSGLVTLNPADPDYARSKLLHIDIDGYARRTYVFPLTLDGSNRFAWASIQEPQATTTIPITVKFGVENEDGNINYGTITQALTIPAGTAVGGTSPPAVVIAAATATYACFQESNWWRMFFSGSFTGPVDANHANRRVEVSRLSPSGNRQLLFTIPAPTGGFVSGTVYNWVGASIDYLPTSTATPNWVIEYLPFDGDGNPGLPLQKTVTVGLPVATAGTPSEGTRGNTDQRGLIVPIIVPVTIVFPTGISFTGGPSQITLWFNYDNGKGVATTWQGWFPISGTSGSITVPDIPVSTFPNITFKAYAYAYPVEKADGIPSGTPFGSYTMLGPAVIPANLITGGQVDKLLYWRNGVAFNQLTITFPYSTHPELNTGRLRVQQGKWSGADFSSTWVPDPNKFSTQYPDGDRPFADLQVSSDFVSVIGNNITVGLGYPWSIPDVTNFTMFRISVYGGNRTGGGDGTFFLETSGFSGSSTAEVIYNGGYVYLKPDLTKIATAPTSWDPSMIGGGLQINGPILSVKTGSNPELLTTNPSFETGTGRNPPGWSGQSLNEFGVEATAGFAQSGSAYYRLTSSGSGGVGCAAVSILYPIIAGHTYVVTGWVTALAASNGFIDIEIAWYTSLGLSGFINQQVGGAILAATCNNASPTPPINWKQASAQFTAPSSPAAAFMAVVCKVGSGATTGFWYCDNFSIHEVSTSSNPTGLDSNGAITVNLTGPLYSDVANNGAMNLRAATDFVVVSGAGGLTLSQNFVNLAKATGFGGTNPDGSNVFTGGFAAGGTTLALNRLGVNYLAVGDALINGQFSFATQNGGKVTISSLGITLANNNLSPTNTFTITSGGLTIQSSGGASIVTSNGIILTGASGNTMSLTSGGLSLVSGVSSLNMTASAITLNKNGVTLTLQANQMNFFDGVNTTATIQNNGFGGLRLPGTLEISLVSGNFSPLRLLMTGTLSGTPIIEFTNPFTLTTASSGSAGAPPAAVSGYILARYNAALIKIPYYLN